MSKKRYTSVEFCAGAGGQAIGLEQAGFSHQLLVDNDQDCCATLRSNRPTWNVVCADMRGFEPPEFDSVDLFAAGLPCPPFSIAGQQLGSEDERDLFPAAFRLIERLGPKAVLIENVRGFLSSSFAPYRREISLRFNRLGYDVDWRLYDAQNFGVPQTRSRVTIVALQTDICKHFTFPEHGCVTAQTVGETLHDLMAANGWPMAGAWAKTADKVAPTIVGGSKKHGGPDLGPTRARAAWRELGVNGSSIGEHAPASDFEGLPRLTTRMVARLQGFPDDWGFVGKKTSAYRQVGNAFPPPVARSVGLAIKEALMAAEKQESSSTRIAAE